MTIVLDTNVVVSALLWSGTPSKLLQRARERGVEFTTSDPLLLELRRTLERPKFAKRLSVAGIGVDRLVAVYAESTRVVTPSLIPRTSADADDDVVLGTAIAGVADLVVSGDIHLLSIRRFRGIPILNAQEAYLCLRFEDESFT